MKIRTGEAHLQGDLLEAVVHCWDGRLKKKFLPREGWEELEEGFYMLSSTAQWVRPLFLLRKKGALVAYEGREAARRAKNE